MVITETWRGEEDPVVIGEYTPSGYNFLNFNRPGDKHGGIAILSKSSLKLSVSPIETDASTFEHACVTDPSKNLRLVAIYRPHPTQTNGFTLKKFLDEFNNFLGVISSLPGKPLLLGDLNIHVNKPHKCDVARYLASLAEHDMHQFVTKPTHKHGNTLDHIICRPADDPVVMFRHLDMARIII